MRHPLPTARSRQLRRCLPSTTALLGALLLGPSPSAATEPSPVPRVEFSVEATARATNDLAQATVYAETTHAAAAEAARQTNAAITAALAEIKRHPGITARTLNARTLPVYAKGGQRVEAWRSRTDLLLETARVDTLSTLLGRLPESLAIGQLTLLPSPETARAAEDQATDEALARLQTRAARIARALGKSYRLLAVDLGDRPRPPGVIHARATMAFSEAAPMAVEAGESTISVSARATIELVD